MFARMKRAYVMLAKNVRSIHYVSKSVKSYVMFEKNLRSIHYVCKDCEEHTLYLQRM
jgi:hypothetical protein